MFNSVEHAYSQTFFKNFKTFDKSIIQACQFYLSSLPLELRIIERKLKFLYQLRNSENLLNIAFITDDDEFRSVCNNYRISNDPLMSWRNSLWNYFNDIFSDNIYYNM